MSSLILSFSRGSYRPVAEAMLFSFFTPGVPDDDWFKSKALNREIIKTNEVQFKTKRFAKYFESNILPEIISNNLQNHQIEDFPNTSKYQYRLTFSESEYIFLGPTILINDISQIIYYLGDFEIDQNSSWQAVIQVQVIDHFGLDDEDPNKTKWGIPYQCLDCGFAAWWILQHKYNFKPFRTLIEYEICLKGQL